MTYKILVVEDDQNIREFLVDSLKEAKYLVKSTGDGAKAIKMVKEAKPDLILLDLGLESVAGETVCMEVKKMYPELPIIILTAKSATSEIVHGLDIGADDYISKPFAIEEILAHIRTRLKQKGTPILEVDGLTIDTQSLEVKRDGKLIPLTAKEFKLLEYLLINRGTVISRETILDHIWMYSPDIESRVVDVYIGYLRKKIDEGFENKLIQSVRGFGYTIK